MPSLIKHLRDAGYDLIDGPVRNHKLLQLWVKQGFNEAELYYAEVNHAFQSPVVLTQELDTAMKVDVTQSDQFGFNIGISLLEAILKSMGMGSFDLSTKIISGNKVTIAYDNAETRIVPLGVLTDYFSEADFRHPNPVLLQNANRHQLLVITGTIMAKHLVVEIETQFKLEAQLLAQWNQAADGKLEFTRGSQHTLKMTAGGNSFFPIAVKASRVQFDKGVFKGLRLVTDNRNFF